MRFGTEKSGSANRKGENTAGAVDGISDQIIHFNNKQFFFGLNESGRHFLSRPLSQWVGVCVYSNGNLEGVA